MEIGVRSVAAAAAVEAIAGKVDGFCLRLSSEISASFQRIGVKFKGRRGKLISMASAESKKCNSGRLSTPLVPESPAGKLLSVILNDRPHNFSVAAAEQLESLASEREGAIARRDHSAGSPQSCLHQRIAEIKESECKTAVEEVMYMMIVHNFSEIKVPMFRRLTWLMGGSLDSFPTYEDELQSLYDHESLDMVKIHLLNILARTSKFDETSTNQSEAPIKRLQLGRIYAASIMYGYFLKSACQRHRLEYLFSLTSKDYPSENPQFKLPPKTLGKEDGAAYPSYLKKRPRRVKNLKSYIMKFDSNAIQICARLKSQEAVELIEKQSRALFLEKAGLSLADEPISVTYRALKHLVLEAVTFGSFLWEAERYVDSVYTLSNHP
ncbi:UV-B-induced protein At3g17800, chloroplastic-like [Wolffia australiana]